MNAAQAVAVVEIESSVSSLIDGLAERNGSTEALKHLRLAHELVCRAIPQLNSSIMAGTVVQEEPIVEAAQASHSLTLMQRAAVALAEARTIDDVKEIRDQATAARIYAEKRNLGRQTIADASAIKLRAERRLGAMLKDVVPHGGGRPPKLSCGSTVFKLDDIGITRDESSRFQRLAGVPDDDFEEYVGDSLAEEEPPTATGLLRHVHGPH